MLTAARKSDRNINFSIQLSTKASKAAVIAKSTMLELKAVEMATARPDTS